MFEPRRIQPGKDGLNMLMKHAADVLAPHLEAAPESLYAKLEYPPQPDLGDVALPCFAFAKERRQSPTIIAQQLADDVNAADNGIRAAAAGGYLNLFFEAPRWKTEIAVAALRRTAPDFSTVGRGQRVVIDMSSPNIAKPFGIGHLRSTMIGNALANLYAAAGYEVVKVNHIGDWGTQFGKLIVAYRRWGDREVLERDPIGESLRLYVRFHEEAERDAALEDAAREAFRKLESGDADMRELWQYFVQESMKAFDRVYARLGVTFDSYAGESFYNDKIEPVVNRLREGGLLEESDGAFVVRLDEQQIPPCLILKKDGSSIYAVRDLATAVYRNDTLRADRLVYVVGAEQSLHFQQVFSVLRKMGCAWADNCRHVAFGLMTVDGKKMSTRRGKVIFLDEVLDAAVSAAEQIIEEKSPNLHDKREVAEAVGVGAVIFGDLKNSRLLSIDFNLEEAVSFDGETGPYLQYTYARIRSLLRKGDFERYSADALPEGACLSSPPAWECLKTLSRCDAVLQEALHTHEPSVVARYLLDLAKTFNRFYNSGKIIDEAADRTVTFAKLSLAAAVANVLKLGLGILGMRAPQEM